MSRGEISKSIIIAPVIYDLSCWAFENNIIWIEFYSKGSGGYSYTCPGTTHPMRNQDIEPGIQETLK